jgi:hypothetical protein
LLTCIDREEVTKEENYDVSGDVEEEEEEWNNVQDWENENDDAEDVQDESTAYLEFLNEEVTSAKRSRNYPLCLHCEGPKVQQSHGR